MESPRAITKILLPGKRNSLLHRPRLVDFLHEHIERKLILVSASPGYGKTSLLIDFAHDTTLPVCWYSLDASDSDPKTFFEYLLASLRRQFPGFGTRTLRLLSDSAMLRDIEVVVGTLVTEIHETIPNYFVIILDDYQAIDESDTTNHIVDTLLRLLPETAHLVLSSRTLPSKLTLTRLTARQEIAGLGVSDLRFTAEEIRALVLQSYHVELSEQDARQLAEHSEGWITGILLSTHSLWQGLFKDLVRVQGAHSHVFNYLANEVLLQQPPEMQRFLIDSSILDQLDPETCNQLLGTLNAAGVLRVIEQKNLFIVRLEEVNIWYRYHHLFREFLQSRLTESDVTRWLDLNRRAATLYEERRDWTQAISYYLKAQAYDEAARLIEQIAKETFDAGHWATLARWIDALPATLVNTHPELLVYRAMVSDEMGDRSRAIECLSRAIEICEQRGDMTGVGRALSRQASCLRALGRYEEAIQTSQRALALIDQDAKRDAADARRILGISHGLLGNWDKCVAELEQALRGYELANDPSRTALVHHDLGVALRTAGKADSQWHFQQALDFWKRANNIPGLANTLNSVGVSLHRQGQYAQAIEALEQSLIEARRCGHSRIEASALASLGDIYQDSGEFGRAQQFYQLAYEIGRQIGEGFIIAYTLQALGETFRLLGDLDTSQRLIQQSLEQAESHHSNYEVALAKTAFGILKYTQGNNGAAAESLERAIELLGRGGAKRDNARAHLHLAQVHFLQRKYRLVGEQLEITSDLAMQLGEDQFAVADGRYLLPLIRHAVSRKIGRDFFAHVQQKIESLPKLPTQERVAGSMIADKPRIEARAFGIATVSINGKLVAKSEWDSASAKELFFYLLANPQGLSKEQILSALWADVSPAKANGIFHSTAYRMRRALEPDCLVFENGLYRINPELNLSYDVQRFTELAGDARLSETRESRVLCWREAAALYRGDYFEDSYSDWPIPIRTKLQNEYLQILGMLADLYEQETRTAEAIAIYQRILDKDSLREETYRSVMHLQIKSGDRAGAVKTYQRCVRALRDEMGLEPDHETQRLFEQISSTSSR